MHLCRRNECTPCSLYAHRLLFTRTRWCSVWHTAANRQKKGEARLEARCKGAQINPTADRGQGKFAWPRKNPKIFFRGCASSQESKRSTGIFVVNALSNIVREYVLHASCTHFTSTMWSHTNRYYSSRAYVTHIIQASDYSRRHFICLPS